MEFSVIGGAPFDSEHAALVVPVFEDGFDGELVAAVDARFCGIVARLRAQGDFVGEREETAVFYPGDGNVTRVLLVGLGAGADASLTVLRRAVGAATRRAAALRCSRVSVLVHPEHADALGAPASMVGRAVFDAAALAAFTDRTYKSRDEDREKGRPRAEVTEITLCAGAFGAEVVETLEEAVVGARAVHAGVRLARGLGNLPGNDGAPRVLAARAQEMAAATGLACRVLGEDALRELGAGALLGVACGSAEPPCLIVLEHNADLDEDPIVLVGKGVTFDTGGISIKGSKGMEEMKFDKCGGTAVLGAMEAIARLGLPRRVVGLVPAVENMPGSRAQRPGDIRTALDGQTVEVINTDAEGRLILADALAYACQSWTPRAVVSIATLTGAVVVALGRHFAGLFSEDDALAEALGGAAHAVGEPVWRMPCTQDYDKQIESTAADVKNVGGSEGGAVTASRFLRRFVREGVPWAHLDVAGVAWMTEDHHYYAKNMATGFGVRLLTEWVATL